ncbi:DNA-binding transcriptional regulator, AcrR family [Nakamurella panacisegetis]|uniref:DNA-binding transcriptional regulator, AcrR family n=1 Tax=Nakamurella panacisegetis TaxID=1090615 RepID=A0A1H0JUI9_9ACTN|nr:TetR/AcrR family transcriptional regulator [Nakamurella panacisegetis]SDO47386.1 DNA-binding transcriptional regulator, AcrR family [Nakamurella panacisegetis]
MTRHSSTPVDTVADPPVGSTSARPLRRDAELNRQKILRAAAEVFAARGLDVTLDDIADHAGVGVGTVYRRFPNKDVLIEALFEDKIEDIVRRAEAAAASPDPWEGLVGFLRNAVLAQARDQGLRQVMHSYQHGAARVAQSRARLTAPIVRLIDAAKTQGRLRADFELTDFPVVMGMVGFVAQHICTAAPEIWQRYLEILIDGLRERPDLEPLPRPALTEAQLVTVMREKHPTGR